MNRYLKILLILLGVIMFFSGITLNRYVIAQNDGKMPVINWNGKSDNLFALYQNATLETKYSYLADRQEWFGFSIGDVWMFLGIFPFMIGLFAKDEEKVK